MSYDPEDNGEIDNATLIAIIRGDYGPEAQAAALEAAGLQVDGDPQTQTEAGNDQAADAWLPQFLAQAAQLEKKIGRELTGKEFKTLEEDQAMSDPPNVMESYDRTIGRNTSDNPDDRRAVAAEVYDELEGLKQLESEGYESEPLEAVE